MGSFLKTASKQVADVRNFLRESAGTNSIKYSAEKGARHVVYIPFTQQMQIDEATGTQGAVKTICAISGKVHEWSTADGKFKATVCIKDVVRKADDGVTILNDGTCPFCDRISDGWEIYNYRKALEEETCKLTGEQRKNHLEKTLGVYADERKAKDPRNYMYILVVKFRFNEQDKEVIGADGLPEYELKVMKLSASRVEKIQQQLANSGAEMAGSELIFQYPNVDDRRLLVSQSTTAPVFPNNQMVVKYPALANKINDDIAKFDWDGIEKAFSEWAGMSSIEAKTITDNMFEQWDAYKKEIAINPQAKYLEYVVTAPSATPSLGGEAPVVPTAAITQAPVVPPIPTVPGVEAGGIPMPNVPPVVPGVTPGVVPGVAPSVENTAPVGMVPPVAPTVPPVAPTPAVDPNGVFGGVAGVAPTVQI